MFLCRIQPGNNNLKYSDISIFHQNNSSTFLVTICFPHITCRHDVNNNSNIHWISSHLQNFSAEQVVVSLSDIFRQIMSNPASSTSHGQSGVEVSFKSCILTTITSVTLLTEFHVSTSNTISIEFFWQSVIRRSKLNLLETNCLRSNEMISWGWGNNYKFHSKTLLV